MGTGPAMPRPLYDWTSKTQKAAAMVRLSLTSICGLAALFAAMLVNQSTFAQDTIAAKAKVCTPCHGEAGIPTQKNIPVIWGQNAGYGAAPSVLWCAKSHIENRKVRLHSHHDDGGCYDRPHRYPLALRSRC